MYLHILLLVCALHSTNCQYTTNNSILQLVAFLGDQINYNVSSNIGMRWSGHLGLRYKQDYNHIYGFSAKTELNSYMKIFATTLYFDDNL